MVLRMRVSLGKEKLKYPNNTSAAMLNIERDIRRRYNHTRIN
jgi:hypothetical protein